MAIRRKICGLFCAGGLYQFTITLRIQNASAEIGILLPIRPSLFELRQSVVLAVRSRACADIYEAHLALEVLNGRIIDCVGRAELISQFVHRGQMGVSDVALHVPQMRAHRLSVRSGSPEYDQARNLELPGE